VCTRHMWSKDGSYGLWGNVYAYYGKSRVKLEYVLNEKAV